MDGFLGYNQIEMAPNDKNLVVFNYLLLTSRGEHNLLYNFLRITHQF